MLARIRRMHLRDGVSIREIVRRTGLARTTVKAWLRRVDAIEPIYTRRPPIGKFDEWNAYVVSAVKANAQRSIRERRTVKAIYDQMRALGFEGSYSTVTLWARSIQLRQDCEHRVAYVPLSFDLGDTFQFDWSCEYAVIEGIRRRLEVAHTKLAASRAFWLTAYHTQTHEMLFDAHTRAFSAFGGVPRRGVYDNMKTAVDRIGTGKARSVNARFQVMCSHYLFEPEFCNPASGWEKGIVEKNVQDRRRQIWREVAERRWDSLAELNEWLGKRCRDCWTEMAHPEWRTLTVAEVLEDERVTLMPCPKPFDAHVELMVRVSATALVTFQRNRYSVPTEYAHCALSLRAYPTEVRLFSNGVQVAQHERSFERDMTYYDWQHYIKLLERKPGALRNGAPFKTMPESMQLLQRQLLRRPGGDRAMAQVLSLVPVHGVDTVLVAVELALEAGRPSIDHVLNVVNRLKDRPPPSAEVIENERLSLDVQPTANVGRYDFLRAINL
jgi:transposase